jgi:hypothetical protein
MIPNKSLVQPLIWNPYIPPINLPNTFISCEALGGIGLSDPTQGLQTQNWSGYVANVGLPDASVYLSAPNTPDTFIFAYPGIVWMRFTFDQNMHPFVSFYDGALSRYFWWDPTIPGNTIITMPAGPTYPACMLDDPRPLETRVGTSDIILGYVNNNNLCYRQQRDRYGVEYVLYSGINNLISNPFVNKIGMNERYRLEFEVGGQLYQ